MKFTTLVIGLLAMGANGLACPDFSGTYVGAFTADDGRDQITTTMVQTGCERMDLENLVTFKNHSSDFSPDKYSWNLSEVKVDNQWYFDGNDLVYLQKDANTEHCDIRDVFSLDDQKNLRNRWRFECPGYTSEWYVSNAGGTWYRK